MLSDDDITRTLSQILPPGDLILRLRDQAAVIGVEAVCERIDDIEMPDGWEEMAERAGVKVPDNPAVWLKLALNAELC